MTEQGDALSKDVYTQRHPWVLPLWLACVSASSSLAITVVLFDRTTPSGVTKQWLASFAIFFTVSFLWWNCPKITRSGIRVANYSLVPIIWATIPIVLSSVALVAICYLFDGAHNYLFSHFYYGHLHMGRNWPVILLATSVLGYGLIWSVRELLLWMGRGLGLKDSAELMISGLQSLFPAATITFGLLLGTVSLAIINVNYWRYWATADGWAVIGHYPMTLTDSYHVKSGGVSPYFISFPLLPAMLSVSFYLFGHNTLGAYVPLIIGNVVLALAQYLLIKEITRSVVLAFLLSCFVVSFPLLRSYTLDMPEADGIFMATLVLAAYFRLRADRAGAGVPSQLVAGLSAGLASLARPEGVLYMAAMYLAVMVVRWRDRLYWVSVLGWGVVIAGFSMITLREFGMIWPGNHSATIKLSHYYNALQAVRESRLFSSYASALGVEESILAVALISGAVIVAIASAWMLKKEFSLIYMPVAAIGNVAMVFSVGPVPAEAAKFHDFFRHISYGIPLLVATVAYGVIAANRYLRGSFKLVFATSIIVELTALVILNLSLLKVPVTPGNLVVRPLMTSDVHIMATELLVHPSTLPVMRFKLSDRRYIPIADEYMNGFPDPLNRHYSASDIRSVGNAVDYYNAAEMVFVGFLVLRFLGTVPFLISNVVKLGKLSPF